MTEEIPLDSNPPTPADSNANSTTAAEEAAAAVPLASTSDLNEEDDEEVNALLDELHEPNEQEIALEKLKQSTSNLKSALFNVSTDIDSKLAISEKAKNFDQNLGLSKTATSTAFAVGSFLGKLQLRQRASNIANSDTVKNITNTVTETLDKTGVTEAVVDGTKKIKNLDEEHKISSVTAGTIAGGVNWVAQGLNSVVGKSASQDEDF